MGAQRSIPLTSEMAAGAASRQQRRSDVGLIAHAVGVSLDDDGFGVVQQAVKQR